jgi:uncharacterized phiE125 gp8 family phage protein
MYYDNYTVYYKQRQLKAKDYVLVTGAVSPALSLDCVKEQLRITDDSSDDYLLSLIKVVTDFAEKITGRDLIDKTYKGFLNCFPASSCRNIQIRKSKLQSITSIQYYKDKVLTTFDASKYYTTESDNGFSTINLFDGEAWPTDADNRMQAVVITFVAGYGDDDCDIPSGLKQAMLSQLTVLYENAGDCAETDGISSSQAKILYGPYILSTKLVCPI